MSELLVFIVSRYRSDIESLGLERERLDKMAYAFERELRSEFGGRWSYLPSEDLADRNRRVLRVYREMLGAGRPEKEARDRACQEGGVSRRTFYNIMNGRYVPKNMP